MTSQQPTCTILSNGTKKWYLHGKRHREDGPAIEYPNGTKQWYLHDQLHRVGGPAIEYDDGDKEWYQHGKLHREDGPAIEYDDGYKEWWYHGENLTLTLGVHSQEEFDRLIKLKVFW
jgi:hypothetical protein